MKFLTRPVSTIALVAAWNLAIPAAHAVSILEIGTSGVSGILAVGPDPGTIGTGARPALGPSVTGADGTPTHVNISVTKAGDADAIAVATGGVGGSGTNGGNGGNGGVATATASAQSQTAEASARAVDIGGSGGQASGGGDGGNGADETMSNAVSGASPGTLTLSQGASAGAGGISDSGRGGNGGNAVSNLTTTVPNSTTVNVNVEADGGQGGVTQTGSGGDGGSAEANASITAPDAQSLTIYITGTGGSGGYIGDRGVLGGQGGSATVTGFGESTSGKVSVSATQTGGHGGYSLIVGQGGDGPSSFMNNAVSGQTSGELDLTQTAVGGSAGSIPQGPAGLAGDAGSILTLHNSAASTLYGNASAAGGEGGSGSSNVTAGGSADAHVDLSALGSANVTSIATATGGAGSPGGMATASAYALSGSGNVYASASATDGDGIGTRMALAGLDEDMVNDAGGNTTGGLLTLLQTAQAGDGGGSDTASGADGGNALSSLIESGIQASEVTASAFAKAGDGGGGATAGGNGGTATANVNLTAIGAVDVTAQAEGGIGGYSPQPTAGGTAVATAFGTSTSGADVSATATAIGGAAGGAGIYTDAGIGADMTQTNAVDGSTSGQLTLTQSVYGGNGSTGIYGRGGRGGDATSTLEVTDGSAATLSGTANAYGGSGGYSFYSTSARGGNAVAEVALNSTRLDAMVTATSTSHGGTSPSGATSLASAGNVGHGSSTAFATASGTNGWAKATSSSHDAGYAVTTSASASLNANTLQVSAKSYSRVGGDGLVTPTEHAAFSSASIGPDSASVSSALATHPHDARAVGSGLVFGEGAMGTTDLPGDPDTLRMSATFSLDPGGNDRLSLDLLDPNSNASGFSSATLSVLENGSSIYSKRLSSLSSAITYFTDHPVSLGRSTGGSVDLVIALDLVGADPSSGGLSFSYLVSESSSVSKAPIPPTLMLFLSALGTLGAAAQLRKVGG